jgi:hypothetical protein
MHHGVGGGKRRGGKTNNLEDLSVIIPGADVYLEGHAHSFEFFINEQTYIDRKRALMATYPAYYCITGHFLNYEDSYAQDYKYRPMPHGSPYHRFAGAGAAAGNFSRKKVQADLYQ